MSKMRRVIGGRILRCRAAVMKAIEHRKKEDISHAKKVLALRQDILNGPSHVFGEHGRCAEIGYFCKGPKDDEVNHVPDMQKTGLYQKLMESVNCLADYSSHLILDVDSNVVEQYNSSIARFTGGKRVNYTQKRSYQSRCAAAVVSHNTGHPLYSLHKTVMKESPGSFCKTYEHRAKRKIELAASRQKNKPKARKRLVMGGQDTKAQDKDYGPRAQKPDMDQHMYDTKSVEFMTRLQKTDTEKAEIEEATRAQGDSAAWMEERRIRLTASNFGAVCNRKPYSSCAPVVQRILYSNADTPGMRYGKENEKVALEQLSSELGEEIKPCGLFIDKEYPFLAATPDGLIGEDGLIEVKCPSTGLDLTPDQVIEQKKGLVGTMWQYCKKTQTYKINERHNYHIQVQGQLHITRKSYCIFAMWTPNGIKHEKIFRDDLFWESEMKEKLVVFYTKCLLPELVDPRRRRNMAIREPDHILKAQETRNTKILKRTV